ncbi:uncharacterized protein BXZ73DRAFT_79907 [Epithele typhae]|uniref:uncharacterized protein n=1 Tax=Epithele typhae TaxID=378194 RepID=UPI002007F7E3|nr:uncharacterized protein BXZ73DRAFT_79907 [Epithele typhae]KAH9921505.1 hypothetical protein BXZ73DRAFT_79907 [Epithele typhae]
MISLTPPQLRQLLDDWRTLPPPIPELQLPYRINAHPIPKQPTGLPHSFLGVIFSTNESPYGLWVRDQPYNSLVTQLDLCHDDHTLEEYIIAHVSVALEHVPSAFHSNFPWTARLLTPSPLIPMGYIELRPLLPSTVIIPNQNLGPLHLMWETTRSRFEVQATAHTIHCRVLRSSVRAPHGQPVSLLQLVAAMAVVQNMHQESVQGTYSDGPVSSTAYAAAPSSPTRAEIMRHLFSPGTGSSMSGKHAATRIKDWEENSLVVEHLPRLRRMHIHLVASWKNLRDATVTPFPTRSVFYRLETCYKDGMCISPLRRATLELEVLIAGEKAWEAGLKEGGVEEARKRWVEARERVIATLRRRLEEGCVEEWEKPDWGV